MYGMLTPISHYLLKCKEFASEKLLQFMGGYCKPSRINNTWCAQDEHIPLESHTTLCIAVWPTKLVAGEGGGRGLDMIMRLLCFLPL